MHKDVISAGPFVAANFNGFLARYCLYTSFRSHCLTQGCCQGQFQATGQGFIGYKFNNGAGEQYGWARVQMLGIPWNRFVLVDYAYGDPGDVVKAGQRARNTDPTMESLGGLALGAAGLLAWRRRRGNKRAAE